MAGHGAPVPAMAVPSMEGTNKLGFLRGITKTDAHDLPSCEFLLPPWLIWLRATINVVDLLVSVGEVALGLLGLFLLISTLGHLENLICKTLESVTISGLVLFIGVEDANAIQEVFKFTQSRLVLLMAPRPLHRIDEMVCFALLIVALGWARLIHVARVLLLLLLPSVEGRLLGQDVLVGHGEHLLWCPGVLHSELTDQGGAPESLLEEHDDWLIVNLCDDISLVAEPLDELPEGLSFLL
jgi:hypothetical protein